MSEGKPERYIIFGAGAIGIAVGALLLNLGKRVAFIARPIFADALKRGVTIKQEDREVFCQAEAVTAANQLRYQPGDVVVVTVKSQVMREAIEELAAACDKRIPVVCLQNGVSNEAVAAEHFENVYAALVLFSAVQLDPQLITMPRGRSIAIGLYPDRVDKLLQAICEDLAQSGFEALASPYVMAMKWGKLIANLNNATHAITGYWVELGAADPEMRELTIAVREEGMRTLAAAGIAAEPPEAEPSPIRISKWTERIRQTRQPLDEALQLPEPLRTYASMHQDLMLGRKTHEADYLNGEIIKLGKRLNLPTPYNSALLEIVNRMFTEGLQAGIHTPAELHALIKNRANQT
ncbi:MAG: 2-dehydropantoate 2-reductase [Acidobacteriota bacterium]